MAASQRQVEIINKKLEYLKEDSQALQDAVSSFVDQVSSSATMCIQNEGMGDLSYRDIRNVINDSHELVLEFLERIKVSPGMDTPDQKQTRGSATSRDMSTSLSSLSSSSNLARPESSLSDHFLLKLQDRLETVEKKMTHVVEMKEEMDGLKEGIDKVKEEMGDFRDEIKGLNDDMKKVKKTKGKVEKIQKRVEELEESKTEMEETISEIRSDHEELSGQVTQLSDNYNENIVKNHGWLRKFEDKMYTHEQSCLSVTSNLQTEIDGLNQQMVNTENRMGEMEKEKEGESAKLKMLEEKMGKVEKDHYKIELMEERVEELEGDMRDVQTIKLEEIEGKISRLEEEKADQEKQKLLDDRLTELEENKKEETKHMGDIQSELKRCVSSVDAIDKRRQLHVAVSARLSSGHSLKSYTVLKCFTQVITNKGGHYDRSSGMFTAPVDGVYLTSLVHTQLGKDCVGLTLYHVVANPGPGGVSKEVVCQTWTDVQYTRCTGVGVVWMSAGDKLYVAVTSGGGNMSICWPSSFSCYLIN